MTALRLEILGTFRLSAGGVVQARFATDKVRALLAYLAVEADRPHSRTALATLLWPDLPDVGARNNARKALHQLRHALELAAPGQADAVLEISRHAVRAASDPDVLALDLAEMARLLDAADAHPHTQLHACAECLRRIAAAAALYKGEVLAGFGLPDAEPFEEWLQVLRESVRQRVLTALHRAAEAHLVRGEPTRAGELATQQVAIAPWREESYLQLMQALDLDGQRGEALAVYERCRAALADLLGVEPQPETQAAHARLRAGGELRLAPSPGGAEAAPRHGFPAEDTPFVGRRDELDRLRELLIDPERRLVTLTGPGGTGKTRLALRATGLAAARGEAFGRLADPAAFAEDGVYFVPLEGVADARMLPEALAVAVALELREREDARAQVLAFLSSRRCLLVLDNAEHLVAGAGFLADMLAAAPGLRMLVTSREVLRLRGEHVFPLSGLDYPSVGESADPSDRGGCDPMAFGAGQLFMGTARRANPDFRLDADGERAVRRICHLVQGLPLAIEMAASWTRAYTPEAIAERIESGADFLVASWRDVPERHVTAAAVFQHSWQLLTEEERRLLARLSVFAGEFDLAAVLAVTGAGAVEVTGLIEKSLLRRADAGRYALHPLLREFAARELAALDPSGRTEEAARAAHGEHHLGLVAASRTELTGAGHPRAMARLAPAIQDIRQAWRWAAEHGRFDLVGAAVEGLARFHEIGRPAGEAAAAFADAAALEDHLDRDSPREHVDVVVAVRRERARFEGEAGDSAQAVELARSAVALADARGTPVARGTARSRLSFQLNAEGEYEAARDVQTEALEILGAAGDERALGHALIRMGQIDLQSETTPDVYRERLRASVERLGEGLAVASNVDDRPAAGLAQLLLAIAHARSGRFDEAIVRVREAIASFRETGDRRPATRAIGSLGFLSYQVGDDDQALACFRQSLEQAEQAGAHLDMARTLGTLTLLHRRRGELDAALASVDRALELLAVHGPRAFHDALLLEKAEVLVARGELDAAEPLIEAGTAAMVRLGHPDHVTQGRVLAARIAAARGDSAGAVASLEALLADADGPEAEGPPRLELWRITGDEAHRRAAIRCFEALYGQSPEHDHRLRLEELGAG